MGAGTSRSSRRSLSTIGRGASLSTVGKLVYDGGEFVLHLLVSRLLGAGPYGIFAYAKTLAFVALLLTNLGADKSVLRHVPQYADQPAKRRFLLGLAWLTSALGGLVVAAVVFFAAPTISAFTLEEPLLVDVLRVFAIILALDTLGNLLYATFRSVEIIEYEVVTKRLLKPTLRVVFVAIALALGASVVGVAVAMAVAGVITVAVAGALFLTRTQLRPTLRSPAASRATVREYYNYSLPLTAKEFGTVLQGRVDVLIVGFFLSSVAVGIYNVSVLIAGALYIPLLAINQLFPPVASRLYTAGKRADLAAVYGTVTRWIVTVAAPLGLAGIVYRADLLALFGAEFTAGTTVLVLFILAQLCNCATGPSDSLLMMTDHQYVVMANEWVFGVANVVLTVVLIQAIGLVGAAAASAGVLAVRNVVKVSEVWYLEGIHPYSRAFVPPLLALALSSVPMLVIGSLASGPLVAAAGTLLGLCTYVGVLLRIGLPKTDRDLYDQLRA